MINEVSDFLDSRRGYTRGFNNFVIRVNAVVVGNNYRASM